MLAKLISCLSDSKRSKRKRFEKILQIASNIARDCLGSWRQSFHHGWNRSRPGFYWN